MGSLQLGPVNLFVINSALFLDKKTSYIIALGGCVPEFFYCALAVFANQYVLANARLIFLLKIIFIVVLITIGLVLFFKRQSVVRPDNGPHLKKTSALKFFFKGFSLAILNPQLMPFWMFVLIYFNGISFLQVLSTYQKIAFIAGAGLGAFMLLFFFIYLVTKNRGTILRYVNNKYYHKALSLFFFVIAAHQIWLLMN
jgi:threonine/homoserine/homoserine lactone efflux protein